MLPRVGILGLRCYGSGSILSILSHSLAMACEDECGGDCGGL